MCVGLERGCLRIQIANLLINGILITSVDNLKFLDVTLDSQITSELQIRNMARALLPKSIIFLMYKLYENYFTRRCFFSFILPHFEYCSPMWLSVEESHLRLLNQSLNSIKFLKTESNLVIEDRRDIGALSVFN